MRYTGIQTELTKWVCLALTEEKKAPNVSFVPLYFLISVLILLFFPCIHLATISTGSKFSKTLYISTKSCMYKRHICSGLQREVDVTSYKSNRNEFATMQKHRNKKLTFSNPFVAKLYACKVPAIKLFIHTDQYTTSQ